MPLVTVLVNYISLSEMDSTQNIDTLVRAAAFGVCSTRHIELFAILCSEPIAVMQIVAELLGRDLAVGYRPVR